MTHWICGFHSAIVPEPISDRWKFQTLIKLKFLISKINSACQSLASWIKLHKWKKTHKKNIVIDSVPIWVFDEMACCTSQWQQKKPFHQNHFIIQVTVTECLQCARDRAKCSKFSVLITLQSNQDFTDEMRKYSHFKYEKANSETLSNFLVNAVRQFAKLPHLH